MAPLVRLLKYEWLIKELISLTPTDHVDYNNFAELQKKFEKINLVNEINREAAEKYQKLLTLNYKFSSSNAELVEPGRLWIREGPLLYITSQGPEKHYIYLLSDAIILATISNNDTTKSYSALIKLAEATISEAKDVGRKS
jgi:hypothetical protein